MNFALLKYSDIATLLKNNAFKAAKQNREFYQGDHWQGGKGYIGDLPPQNDPAFREKIAEIKSGFQSDNVIKEIVKRHVAGILGKEPGWGLAVAKPRIRKNSLTARPALSQPPTDNNSKEPPNLPALPQELIEADESLTEWWDNRKLLKRMKKLLRTSLLEDKAIGRLYVPRGLRQEDGLISADSISEALKFIHIQVLSPDVAGVFTDADTEKRYGVYLFKRTRTNAKNETIEERVAEISYLDDQGRTILRVLLDDGTVEFSNEAQPYELGGQLTIFQMEREHIVTEQIRQNQMALNLNLTMMMRNVNLAGSRERMMLNAEPPGEWIYDEEKGEHVFKPAPFYTGARTVNWIQGALLTDENGQTVGRANPNVSYTEPVDTSSFIATHGSLYSTILKQAHQLHVVLNDSAMASGRSRVEARADFETSLNDSKEAVDDAGRWMLTTALHFAAIIAGRPRAFEKTRVAFDAIVEPGPVGPEESNATISELDAGLRSKEGAMIEIGIDDPQAELNRIEQESQRFDPAKQVSLEKSKLELQQAKKNLKGGQAE